VIDWKKIQQNVYLPSCGEQFVANLGQVRSQGGDIDLTYKPVQPLTLGLMVAYTDAKYSAASCAGVLTFDGTTCSGTVNGVAKSAPPIVSKGDRLQGAPWTFIVSAEYADAAALFGGKTAYGRLDYQQTTAQTALLPGQNSNNALFDTTIPGLPTTKDLSLRFGLRFSGFDLSIFGNNLTNQHPLLFSSRDLAVNAIDNLYFGRSVRPLTVGITGTYHY